MRLLGCSEHLYPVNHVPAVRVDRAGDTGLGVARVHQVRAMPRAGEPDVDNLPGGRLAAGHVLCDGSPGISCSSDPFRRHAFVSALMALSWGSAIFVAAFSGVVIFVGISYWVNAHNGELGGTTEFTTLIAFLLGAMILFGYIEISLAATVVVLTLLSLKFRIREIMGKVTREELYAVIQFIVVLLMIFPFLPDHTIGPYQVFNPRELGNVIVIISGIGLGGYILSRDWYGKRHPGKWYSRRYGVQHHGVVDLLS